jgi:hypothetical protein
MSHPRASLEADLRPLEGSAEDAEDPEETKSRVRQKATYGPLRLPSSREALGARLRQEQDGPARLFPPPLGPASRARVHGLAPLESLARPLSARRILPPFASRPNAPDFGVPRLAARAEKAFRGTAALHGPRRAHFAAVRAAALSAPRGAFTASPRGTAAVPREA